VGSSQLQRLQEELQRIPAVQSARVIGNDQPSEIHIVATGERSAKQLVRDVQSLSAAGFGMTIDHRIVSIVQLEGRDGGSIEELEPAPGSDDDTESEAAAEDVPEAPFPPGDGWGPEAGERPMLERIVQANAAGSGWVKVALQWPSGDITEGVGVSGASREARARGAAAALLQALRPRLEARGARIDVEHVVLHRMGAAETVVVRATFYGRGGSSPLVGVALLHDDAASATVRALLHAVNRKLEEL
jgi:hypothetical protein